LNIKSGAESSHSSVPASQESHDFIAGNSVKRKTAHRVMTTGQPGDFARYSAAVELVVGVLRKFRKKRKIVAARDHQTTPVCAAKFLDKRMRADRGPEKPEMLKINRALK